LKEGFGLVYRGVRGVNLEERKRGHVPLSSNGGRRTRGLEKTYPKERVLKSVSKNDTKGK